MSILILKGEKMSARLNKEQKGIIRARIIEESYKLFSEKGYEATRTKEIAKAVGIAEGTLFNYFKSKEYLFIECMAEKYKILEQHLAKPIQMQSNVVEMVYDLLIDAIKGPVGMPKSFLREMAHVLTWFLKKKSKTLQNLMALDYKVIENLEELLQECMDKGLMIKTDSSTAAYSIFSVAIMEIMMYVYLDEYDRETLKQAFKQKIEFVMKGWIIEQ
jgi:AcrR family transcriptional regulator